MRARTGRLALVAVLAALPASSALSASSVMPASSAAAQTTIEPQYVEEMEVLTARQAVQNALSRVEDLD